MATPKKPATKKPAAKKPAAKSTPSKAPAKRASASAKKSAPARSRLFAVNIVPDTQPFMTFRMTTQTLYWLIFGVTILALGLWVLKLNLEIISLYDQIDQNNIVESQTSPTSVKKALHK